ncbi:FecCD family ABC transporter permease [Perlabentimonas gracilis]|uniref:FecCD family ABC transporter permease n=1 Tax=Perlabentimonas gracilis TaxID=2715279 RepID=UPI00140957A7|nr:iron ABC transporter permease [Perlabentimonas gracilis]NHB68221.1 iron ABC transporter permease [Perlabentimonas gracilis]
MKSKNLLIFGGLVLLLLAFFVFDLLLGSVSIPWVDVVKSLFGQSDNEIWTTIVRDFRLPKSVTAVLAGAALSVSGLQMQTTFRNPLAGPYVLGISAGASLGVAIMVLGIASVGASSLTGLATSFSLAGAAIAGAMLVLLVVLAVSVRVKDIMTILILGMMFGSGASALVSVLQFFSSESMLKAFVIWTMGSLSSVAGMQLQVFAIIISVGLVLSIISIRMLNVMLLGDAYAKGVGLNLTITRVLIFSSTSLLAGGVTAFCGPIGFIGIAVPHVARMVFRTANHSVLIPGVMLLGSIAMLFADIVSQLPGFEVTLPINSVTALLGIPIVVYVVIKNQRFAGV